MKIIVYPEIYNIYAFISFRENFCTNSNRAEIEVETDKVEKWKKVFKDFEEIQSELKHLFYTK